MKYTAKILNDEGLERCAPFFERLIAGTNSSFINLITPYIIILSSVKGSSSEVIARLISFTLLCPSYSNKFDKNFYTDELKQAFQVTHYIIYIFSFS